MYFALKFCPCWTARFKSSRMLLRRVMNCAFPAAPERRKADLLLQQLYLIRKGGLAHKNILRRAAEIQRVRQFDAAVDLFGGHGVPML